MFIKDIINFSNIINSYKHLILLLDFIG